MDEEAIISSGSILGYSLASQVTSGVQYAVPTREQRRSSFMRAIRTDSTEPQPHCNWPAASRYFDALTMDAASIVELLVEDTLYENVEHPWCLDYTFVTDNTLHHCDTQAGDCHEAGIFSPEVLTSRLTLVYIRQRRLYMKGDTTSVVSVDAPMWLALLNKFEILPSFIELLHNNNGCTLNHTSFDRKEANKPRSDCSGSIERTPEAFHVGYKMGSAMDEEHAFYARYDFKTGCTLMFILGTDASAAQTRALRLLEAEPHASLFHLIFAFQSTILAKLERIRWRLDYTTQDLEAETGFTTLKRPGSVTSQKLQHSEWNRDKIVAAWEFRFLKWAAARMVLNLRALLRDMDLYEDIYKCHPGLENLRTACQFQIEIAQSQHDNTLELQSRVDSQLDAIRTLKAQRDTDLNIEIAKATKHDSELMHRITLITMLFLPATFVATFFSMVFFQVETVRPAYQIWWYPAVSTPLTLAIIVWYFARSKKATWEGVIAFCQAAMDFGRPEKLRLDDRERNSSMHGPQGTR